MVCNRQWSITNNKRGTISWDEDEVLPEVNESNQGEPTTAKCQYDAQLGSCWHPQITRKGSGLQKPTEVWGFRHSMKQEFAQYTIHRIHTGFYVKQGYIYHNLPGFQLNCWSASGDPSGKNTWTKKHQLDWTTPQLVACQSLGAVCRLDLLLLVMLIPNYPHQSCLGAPKNLKIKHQNQLVFFAASVHHNHSNWLVSTCLGKMAIKPPTRVVV